MRRRHGLTRVAATLVLLGACGSATAELRFHPYVAAQHMYESNVYRFSTQVADVTGTTDTADTNLRYTVGVDSGYSWGQQDLRVMAEGRRFRFGKFTHLDHEEDTVAAALEGGILGHTRFELTARDEHRMASFEDRRSTQLIMERDQTGSGEIAVAVRPNWRAVVNGRGRYLRSPLPDAPALPEPAPGSPARVASPDFALHEWVAGMGVRYGIEDKSYPEKEAPLLVEGLLEYSRVSFSGVTPQPPPPPGVTPENFDGYTLLTGGGKAAYTIDGLSRLHAKLAAVAYNPSASTAGDRPDMTGLIGYTRRLSIITEVNAQLFRRIVPHAANADSTVDTGMSLGARWEPLRDFTVLAEYSFASSGFSGLSGVVADSTRREDTVQTATLSAAYPHRQRLYIRFFGGWTDRRSNLDFNEYQDVTAGLELSFRWTRLPEAQ